MYCDDDNDNGINTKSIIDLMKKHLNNIPHNEANLPPVYVHIQNTVKCCYFFSLLTTKTRQTRKRRSLICFACIHDFCIIMWSKGSRQNHHNNKQRTIATFHC